MRIPKYVSAICGLLLLALCLTNCARPIPPMRTATSPPTAAPRTPTAAPTDTPAVTESSLPDVTPTGSPVPTPVPTPVSTPVPTPVRTPTAVPTGTPTASPTGERKMKVRVDPESSLRVRSSPTASDQSNIIGYLLRDDVVLVIAVADCWASIRTADGSNAYCSAELLFDAPADAVLSALRLYPTATPSPTPAPTAAPGELPDVPVFYPTATGPLTGYVIGVNPGHQGRANTGREPVSPGSSTTKQKVAGGTTGCVSRVPESRITLDTSLLLRDKLLEAGATVVMIRTTQDADISNMTRALIFNRYRVDLAVSLHCNGTSDSSVKGVLMVLPASNPYLTRCDEAAAAIKTAFIAETGAVSSQDLRYDTLTTFNWAETPSALIEMGFLSNPEEDALLTDAAYQAKMAKGICDGIAAYCVKYAPFDRG